MGNRLTRAAGACANRRCTSRASREAILSWWAGRRGVAWSRQPGSPGPTRVSVPVRGISPGKPNVPGFWAHPEVVKTFWRSPIEPQTTVFCKRERGISNPHRLSSFKLSIVLRATTPRVPMAIPKIRGVTPCCLR